MKTLKPKKLSPSGANPSPANQGGGYSSTKKKPKQAKKNYSYNFPEYKLAN